MAGLGDNPRYANYARCHGRTPEEQLAHDEETHPSACMMEFVFWNQDRLKDYAKVNPQAFMQGGSGPALIDHPGYDAWLDKYEETV